ncbi:MAG TPA: hypothetical protein VMV45_00215 [Casimicrobiaceae bacterium]|nr:hypothetical protein [Casimicrobiaceae bacterium]
MGNWLLRIAQCIYDVYLLAVAVCQPRPALARVELRRPRPND